MSLSQARRNNPRADGIFGGRVLQDAAPRKKPGHFGRGLSRGSKVNRGASIKPNAHNGSKCLPKYSRYMMVVSI
jgi:hypothetical protein